MVIEWARAVSNFAILHSTAENAIMHDAREYWCEYQPNTLDRLSNFSAIVNTKYTYARQWNVCYYGLHFKWAQNTCRSSETCTSTCSVYCMELPAPLKIYWIFRKRVLFSDEMIPHKWTNKHNYVEPWYNSIEIIFLKYAVVSRANGYRVSVTVLHVKGDRLHSRSACLPRTLWEKNVH